MTIRRPLRAAGLLAGTLLIAPPLVTACSGATPAPSRSGSPVNLLPSEPATTTPVPGPAMITTVPVKGVGRVLGDYRGKTLYTKNDPRNLPSPLCVGACTNVWQPVALHQKSLTGTIPGTALTLGILPRPDGTHQLAINGHRVYTFSSDRVGDIGGNGFINGTPDGTIYTWQIIKVPTHTAGTIPLHTTTTPSPTPSR